MAGHERYRLLDEMRGVAALAVLVFHIGTRGGGPLILPNGFLAVDFFFMLSGFVIAEIYETRLAGGMSFTAFAARRLVRMAPVAMLGALEGSIWRGTFRPSQGLRLNMLRHNDDGFLLIIG